MRTIPTELVKPEEDIKGEAMEDMVCILLTLFCSTFVDNDIRGRELNIAIMKFR